MIPSLRNRIKGHRRVRLGDLVPHEDNARLHSLEQKTALELIYQEVGFARSVLAFEMADGRLKLIDGHLRAELTPDEEVEVEILDVTEEEARKLLLVLDPLSALADYDEKKLAGLLAELQDESEAVNAIWNDVRQEEEQIEEMLNEKIQQELPREQFLILITCADEQEQLQLLERFQREGLRCEAKVG